MRLVGTIDCSSTVRYGMRKGILAVTSSILINDVYQRPVGIPVVWFDRNKVGYHDYKGRDGK